MCGLGLRDAGAEQLQNGLGMPGGPKTRSAPAPCICGRYAYRIHGTNEAWTIGTSVSSGCIRLTNDDVTDLYNRTPVGTKVIVLAAVAPTATQ